MGIFYVFQGDTYYDERDGGFVWSPNLNENGRRNNGYTTMTFIKKGDFILHNFDGKMMAISIAQTNCFEAKKPSYKRNKGTAWNDEGYRVDTDYYELEEPVEITKSQHKSWLASNHKSDSAFTIKGTGKQQYMCSIDTNHAIYLLKAAIESNQNTSTIQILKDTLVEIEEEKVGDYDSSEKEMIDDLIENQEESKPTWNGHQKPQEMMTVSSLQKERPKRNFKIAADALARADYKCEYNINDRIFKRKSGKGYTEPHHLIPISKYKDFDYKNCSLDTMENIVSLCSHCHNLLHYGKFEDKKPILEKLYNERKTALSNVGLDITLEGLEAYYQ